MIRIWLTAESNNDKDIGLNLADKQPLLSQIDLMHGKFIASSALEIGQ